MFIEVYSCSSRHFTKQICNVPHFAAEAITLKNKGIYEEVDEFILLQTNHILVLLLLHFSGEI